VESRPDTAVPSRGLWAWLTRWFRADDSVERALRAPASPQVASTESRTQRGGTGAVTPAGLAQLPDVPLGPAPWDGANPVVSAHPDDARTAVLEFLWGEVDRATEEGNRAFLQRLARECGSRKLDFPLFPDAALQIDAVLRGKDPSVADVARIVRREPDLVRRVWQDANGVNFARKAASLDEAIVRIGYDALWRIGMRACMNAPVFRVRGFQDEVNHVRAVSIVTAELASGVSPGGDVYLAGLLHAIGKLVVYRAAMARPPAPEPDPELVRRLARALHAQIGVLVADAWKLSPDVVAAVAFAPDPGVAAAVGAGGLAFEQARAVRAGCIAAHTAAEARAGREVGGLMALVGLPGPPIDAARLVARAHDAWNGLAQSDDGARA
jgi:HD-like signal output (HDOD) protein